MILASWNILSDSAVPRTQPQSGRVIQISRAISQLKQGDSEFIIFLCECETVENIQSIASLTNLKVLGEPSLSRSRKEYGAFLVDGETVKRSELTRHVVGREPNSALELRYKDLSIVGVHFLSEVIKTLGEEGV